MTQLVGADGLGADGLKIDFTARTPSGQAYSAHGPGWGIALLHELLSVVYSAVKQANPEALVITHTPHPAFADVTDMVRLNDMLRLDDPVRFQRARWSSRCATGRGWRPQRCRAR